MGELSNKIKAIRGALSADVAAKRCGLSRESFYRIERGGSVKYETLKQISVGFGLSQTDWLELLVAWLKTEAGEDESKLWIERKESSPSTLRDGEDSQVARAMMLFKGLNANDRKEITNAMRRAEVRGCLPAINRVWEKFEPSSSNVSPSNSTADTGLANRTADALRQQLQRDALKPSLGKTTSKA